MEPSDICQNFWQIKIFAALAEAAHRGRYNNYGELVETDLPKLKSGATN